MGIEKYDDDDFPVGIYYEDGLPRGSAVIELRCGTVHAFRSESWDDVRDWAAKFLMANAVRKFHLSPDLFDTAEADLGRNGVINSPARR